MQPYSSTPSRPNRRRSTRADPLKQIETLEATVKRRSISDSFGCLTRPALDDAPEAFDLQGFTLIYFDVDHLHEYNAAHGKTRASDNIRYAIEMRSSDLLIGQYFSGDEFVAIVPDADASGLAARIQARLHERGMSATFVLMAGCVGATHKIATLADDVCATYKAAGMRDSIFVCCAR